MTCGVSGGLSRARSLTVQLGSVVLALAWTPIAAPLALQAQGATADSATPAAPSDATASTTTPPIAAEQTLPKETGIDWDLLHRRYSSWSGPSGGLYLLDGRSGEPGAIRAQLALDGFSGSDYLRRGDKIEVSSQSLVLSVTASHGLEFFATLNNRATNRVRPNELSLDALGDVATGVKFAVPIGKLFDFGGDLRVQLLNAIGGGGFEWGATSVWLRTAVSLDLMHLPRPFPFVARLNVGYLFDNSAKLVEDIEDQRFENLEGAAAKADETRQLATRFERLANGINRLDRFTFGAGIEFPIQIIHHFYVHPIAEWTLGLPVNRQDYDCAYVASNAVQAGTNRSSDDSCYERNPSSLPMNVAFAVRVVPPVRGLSALVGIDFGLSGTARFVRDLAPNLPWRFLFAFSFDYDARPAPTTVVVEKAPPTAAGTTAVRGRVRGTVSNANGAPVADARVNLAELPLSTLLTAADGRFITEPLPPGPVALDISHPDFQTGRCNATIPENGADIDLRCTLLPKPLVGKLSGQLTDASGTPVSGARVIITGPTNALVLSDARGGFLADNLTPGTYVVRIEAPGFFTRQVKLQINGRDPNLVNPGLTRRPIVPGIVIRPDGIDAPGLTFLSETSTELSASALAVIAEIADLLLTRSDLYLQVQGYGADVVSTTRALLIKQRLVDAGVPETHVEAVGGGRTKVRLVLHQ